MTFTMYRGGAVLFLLCSMEAFVFLVASPNARAESTEWDSLLSNSYWYVPSENMLAYMSPGTSFANPVAAADQTLWSIGTATNGAFTGNSTAYLKVGPIGSTSTNTMEGLVTESGQIRIIFTSTTGGPTTTGIGQMRDIDGTLYMQMQMITGTDGSGGVLTTHWAYMASYDPETFTPPEPTPEVGLRSTEWAWVQGTTWNLHNDALFGTDGVGTFTITDYHNGYFWGSGTGPEGSNAETFTQMASATPEGNLLFNILSNDTLTSLTGQITGTDTSNGVMALRNYDGTTFGPQGFATPVPEPSSFALLAVAIIGFGFYIGRRNSITGKLTKK